MQSVPALRAALIILAVAVIAPLIAFALYMYHFGSRAVRERRYPPTGVRMIRNTPVHQGDRAVRRGRLFQWLAGILLVAGVGFIISFWRLLQTLPSR